MSIKLAEDKEFNDHMRMVEICEHERYLKLVEVIPNIRGEGAYAVIERDPEKGNRATLLRSNGEILDEKINKIIMGIRR